MSNLTLNVSSLTLNDVLETGIEINDGSDDSQTWNPFKVFRLFKLSASGQWTRIKIYLKKNFDAWKATLTVFSIIELMILLYMVAFIGKIKNLDGEKRR